MTSAQDHSGWLTVPEMARRLDVSQANLKRRIRDGKPVQIAPGRYVDLDVEMIDRPQGHEYRVRVRGDMPALRIDQPETGSEEAVPPSTDHEQSRALDILDALFQANAKTMERQAERLERYADLLWQETAKRAAAEERADQAERERTAAQDALMDAQAALDRERAAREQAERELRERRWWRWWT